MVRLLETISGKFESLDKSMKLIAKRQSLSMTGVPQAPLAGAVECAHFYNKR